MNAAFNFELANTEAPVTAAFRKRGITAFSDAVDYVRNLSYKRISNRDAFLLVLEEQCGTCSSKHQLLAALAHENGHTEVQLTELLFRMNETNVPGTGKVLEEYSLPWIPEAHNFLRIGELIIDATSNSVKIDYVNDKISETPIAVTRTTAEKHSSHQKALEHWQQTDAAASKYTPTELRNIREKCIAAISQ
jgi:hypothetical protein